MPYTASVNIVEHKPRLLLFWISGKGGALMDDLTDEEVLEHSKELLHNFFSNDYNVSDPVAMIRFGSRSVIGGDILPSCLFLCCETLVSRLQKQMASEQTLPGSVQFPKRGNC